MTIKTYNTSKIIGFSTKQLLDLVGDVKNYDRFLPWCKAVKIYTGTEENFDAELLIGYKNFRVPFSSNVQIDAINNIIKTRLIKNRSKGFGLFTNVAKHLNCIWAFKPIDENTSEINILIDYEFADPILGALLNANINKASKRLIEAFETEAKNRYLNGV